MTQSPPSPDNAHQSATADESTTLVRLKADAPIDAHALVDELFSTLSPRFHGLRKLGQGGMGTVYIARDPLLKRDVAIKVLAPHYGADPSAHERFLREAQAAAAVAHPNVVSIFQVGELPVSHVPYFVMQFIEGETLEQAFPAGAQVPEPVARRIVSEIAAALSAAHARGLVHRDIKPSNVMIDRHTGRAIVLDFGISATVQPKPLDEKLTAPGVYVGTPRYMSPEQSSGEGVTAKSDMYSLGCVAYELLTGTPVFAQKNVLALLAAHLRDTPRPVSEVRPAIDREFGALVTRCLEKEPEQRPDAGEMAQRLTPGGSVLLEWPPPGLELLHGKLRGVTRALWAGSALALGTGLTLILAGGALPSAADSVATVLLLALGGMGVIVLLVAAWRAIQLGRAATSAVRNGYAWLTVAETLADADGGTGDVITGSRRFALLSSAQRNALRRARLTRAGAMFLGGLTPIPALMALLLLAAVVPVGYPVVLGVLLLPAAAALVAVRITARERLLAPPPKRAVESPASRDAARLAPAWYEAFGRARVGQTLGDGGRRHARLGAFGGAVVAALAVLVLGVLAPLAAYGSLGAMFFQIALPRFELTVEKLRLAEVARPYAVPKDGRITPLDAGASYYALQERLPKAGPFVVRPLPTRPPRPWRLRAPARTLFAMAVPDSTIWAGPHPSHVLEATTRGFTPEELEYLRMIATADVWRDWGVVARASAGDIIGAQYVLPSPTKATKSALPIPGYSSIKDVAYASLSRAAYHLALGRRDSAETALRETIAVGFFLVDNGNHLIDQLIGAVIVGIGRDGLTRYHTLTGNPAGAGLKAKWEAAAAARDARADADPLRNIARSSATPEAPAARRQTLAWATQPTAPRGFRLEMLSMLGMAPCTNVRELVFGPDPEIREAFQQARKELVRYPSDLALIMLIEELAERGAPQAELDLASRVLVEVAGGVGFVLRNQRLRGCMEVALHWGM